MTEAPSLDPVLGINPVAVEGWMQAIGLRPQAPLDFHRIGEGKSNLTLQVADAAGSRWVLRRPPLGDLLASAHDVAREARILSALAGSEVPVPTVVAVADDPAVCPVPLVLMEHVDGLVVDSMGVAEDLPLEVRASLSDSLVAGLGSIHAVDLEVAGLTGLASHGHYGRRQLRRWSAQWEHAKTRELRSLDELTDILGRSLPPQQETVLVHGDFHLRNVIVAPEAGSLRAVLDWELATLGDPIADLGSFLAYWPEAGDPPTPLFAASALPGFKTRDELTAAYLEATGRDGSTVAFWHVLGLWKIAIICEGVLRRALNDPHNVTGGEVPGPDMVDRLIDRAHATWAARERSPSAREQEGMS